MIEKTMKSRHVQKHATESEWLKANIFIPKQAEIIVYDVDENHPYERFKIGDGVTLLANLPFSNETIDLTVYATKDWVDQYFVSGDDLDNTGFATQDWVADQRFAPAYLATRTLEKVTADEMATVEGNSESLAPLTGAVYHGGIYDSYALRCELTSQGTTIKVPRIEVKTQEEYDALEIKDETTIYIIKE